MKPEMRPASLRQAWPDPTPEMLDDPRFNAIWNVIKDWDINVPDVYAGYCSATGNHVRKILDSLPDVLQAAANVALAVSAECAAELSIRDKDRVLACGEYIHDAIRALATRTHP